MAQEDNLHKLYINLTDDGYNLGTEDEFRKQLQNKATAEKFHQNMVDDGYQLGSFDEFVSMNGLSYQMPQSQLPADQVERRVQTARVPQPGERIEATHVDKDGNVLQTDTTQLVRGKVATVEIGTPQFTPPSSHESEELARRNGYYNTKESLDDIFSYRPNEYGEMRYGWQRGQRIKQLNRTGLEFMNRTGAYDENYDQAASQAEKMSDAQLVAEFNKLSGQIGDAGALANTPDGYAMATALRAYSHELRARDIGFAHGSENKKGIGHYRAAMQDPEVRAEILKQENMSPEQRKAYLANAYKHIMAGESGQPDVVMLAGTMIHAKDRGMFPEEAYNQVVGIINNEHAEDVLAGAMQSADAEIARLEQLIEQRTQQLFAQDEAEGMSLAKVMQHAESGSGAPIFNQRLLNDPELSMLWTAKRAAERRKKVIERKQDNHGFMRQFIGTFWDTATDINTWDFGIQDMRDAVNLASFSGNKSLSVPMERAREAMLQNTVDAQEAEQRWKLSAAQRWGVIGGQALPFVAEFIGTGGGFSGVRQGVTKGVTSFLERSLGKAASNKAAQWLVRSTGMLTGDIASALLMTNTTGSLKTYSDILDRKAGDLMQLYDGTFVYRNSTTMGDAILKGEVANTLEYYTEMLGNHLDGLISGVGKRLGLSRLSEGMKWLTGRQIQQLTTNVLRQGGINELPSEILEEEANLILNAMLVGDNNFDTGPLKELANKFGCNFEVDPNSEDYQRSIFNPETQADIWGGMLFSIGAMRAPSVAIGTVGQGWNAANYYYYKHKTDLAGTKLNALVGGDELLDRINNTTNEQIPSLVAGILADDDFTPDMKSLAMDYIGNLVKERGYNVRMFDNAKDLDPEQDQEEGETVDLSYQEGYNAADEEQAGVKERVDVARAWLYNLGFDDSNIESLSGELPEAWLAALSDEQREAVEEYTNAMAAYEGMLQHVQDDMEGAIAESEAAVDAQTHIETGAVHHAVLKTGGEVWVVGGNVALTPDGNIDIENSDGDLIVLDPATGGKRMIHISDLASADEPVMADQLKQDAAATIQETMATDASNRIDGVLSFQPGDEYTLPFGEELHTIQIVDDAGDGVNVVVTIDGGGEQKLMPRQMIQDAADALREARIAEQAAGPAIMPTHGQAGPTEITEETDVTEPVEGEWLYSDQPIREVEKPRGTVQVFTRQRKKDGMTVTQAVAMRNGEEVSAWSLAYIPWEEGKYDAVDINAPEIVGIKELREKDGVVAATLLVRYDDNSLDTKESKLVPIEKEKQEDAMPMNGDEVDWFATSPERGHRFLYDEAGLSPEEVDAVVANSVKDAEKELDKVSKKAPKPGTAAQLNKYRAEKEAHEQQVAAAQAAVDYWKGVQATQQQVVADLVRRQADERAAQDAAARRAAIEAVAQYQAEQEAKKAEQAERGPFTPGWNVIDKWKSAKKIDGRKDAKVLADGTVVSGHYVLHEAGATTPSHDPATGWKPTEGFPVNENGGSVNDRDYERDRSAQEITIRMSETFDGRAYQDVPIISDEGIDYSGNGRTIAGDMAARNNTDGAYLETARQYSEKYGFTAEDMDQFQHPRVDFMLDNRLPYTPDVFAKFNAQEMKGQNLTESAVKLGKTVDDTTFNDIVGLINQFDTMSDFYADGTAPTEAITLLLRGGVITPMQHAQMFDGDKVSGQGREMLENLLLGKAFEGNPEAIRQIRSMPSVRQQIVGALSEVANNSTLGDYSLEDVISQAVALVYKARNDKNSSVKQGDSVSDYARQLSLFPNITGGATIADLQNTMVLLLGDILNGRGQLTFKNVLIKYNYSASQTVGYTGSFFTDASPDGLLKDAIQLINNSNKNEIKQEITAAVEQRKSAARQGGEPVTAVNTGDEGGAAGEPAAGQGNLAQTEVNAPLSSEVNEFGVPFVLSSDGTTTFGEVTVESGLKAAPIKLSLGENSVDDEGVNHGYGYLHIDAGHGQQILSPETGFKSIEEFVETVARNYDTIREGNQVAGNQTYLLELSDEHNNTLFIQLSHDGSYWNVNSAGIFRKKYSRRMREVASLLTIGNSSSTETVEVNRGQKDGATATSENSSLTSGDKGSTENANVQGNSEKNVGAAVAQAEAEVDTEPTDGQKEAGNYKKGHVKVYDFDVTIEQPKGSVRSGVDASGKAWSQEMHNTYGYIRGTEGVDGDHIDVFLSDHMDDWNGNVYVVDQVNKDGSFDEHKVMYGFDSEQEARDAYLSNYEEGWTGLGNITGVSREEFKKWVDSSHRKTKPFAEYKSVKVSRPIQGLEGYTEDEILADVRAFIEQQLEDAGIEGVTIKGMALHGSRMRGDARPDSDLDVVVEYEGDISEDSFFNLVNYDLNFRGPNGVIIDINPITRGKSGTLEQYMERSRRYDEEKQNADKAGAHETETQAENEMKPVEEPSQSAVTGNLSIAEVKDRIKFSDKEEERLFVEVADALTHDGLSISEAPVEVMLNSKEDIEERIRERVGDYIAEHYPTQATVSALTDSPDGLREREAMADDQELAALRDEVESEVASFNQSFSHKLSELRAILGKPEVTADDVASCWKDAVEFVLLRSENQEKRSETESKREEITGKRSNSGGKRSSVEKAANAVEVPKDRLDDVGEKIEGAKKDIARKMSERIDLGADSFMKMFPKYDLKKLISQGLDTKLAVATKMLRQMAQDDYKKHNRKRGRGKSYALESARFYAAYAKQILEAGDTSVEFTDYGWSFTDYGKRFVELNIKLFDALHEKLGDDLFDLDLSGVQIVPISPREGTTYYRRNAETGKSEEWQPAYGVRGLSGGAQYYEDGQFDNAIAECVESVAKSVDYNKAHPYKLSVYYNRYKKDSYYVGVKIGGEVQALTEPGPLKDTSAYMRDHESELQAKAAQLDDERKQARKGSKGEGGTRWKPELTLGGGRPRVGVDRRGGRDISPDEFRSTFNFRGVQFGNYVTQRERQRFINESYDALLDMAELLGISPRAVSLDGRLGFAIGARGGGSAAAHYEPGENVINLTKTNGAGSLAHEWFHALDFYFNRGAGRKSTSATANTESSSFPAGVREEMRNAFLDLMNAINGSEFYQRSVALERKLHPQQFGEGYYDKPTELGARAFQDYVVRRLADRSQINDFLSSFTEQEQWNGEPENYPYPYGEEADRIDEKFDTLFGSMLTREDEQGNTVVYSRADGSAEPVGEREAALRDALVEVLRGAGIEVVTDAEEGQRVLDAVNGRVQMQRSQGESDLSGISDADLDKEYLTALDVVEKPSRIEKLRNSAPVNITKADYDGKYALNASDAQSWIKDNLRGEHTIKDTGEKILISKVGAEEVTSHSRYDDAHLKSISSIPRMLEDAIFIEEQASTKPSSKFDSFRYYVVGLTIDGVDYTAKIVIGVKQGKKYYDHRLTQMEKTKLIDFVNQPASGFTTAGNASLPPYTGSKDSKLVSLLQTKAEEIAEAEAKMRDILDEMKRRRGYSDDSSYQGTSAFNGAAPARNAYFPTREERVSAFDNGEMDGDANLGDFMDAGLDLWDLGWQINDPRSYRGADEERREAIRNLREVVNGKKKTVTMYRSIPSSVKEESFRNGDWITPSRRYAEENAEIHGWGDEYRIIEQEVPVDDVWWDGNDIAEWGYDNSQGEVYKNTANNRKSDDLVTRDDEGNVILPSQRYDERKGDIRYFRTADGTAYGFVKDGKIYIDPRIATSETPVHEYGHMWCGWLKKANPKAWARLCDLMLGQKDVLDYVKRIYPELEGDALVEEVFNHYSGRRGAERLRREEEAEMAKADGIFNKARIKVIFDKIRRALRSFWELSRDLFAGKVEGIDKLSAEDFADMALADLLGGFNGGDAAVHGTETQGDDSLGGYVDKYGVFKYSRDASDMRDALRSEADGDRYSPRMRSSSYHTGVIEEGPYAGQRYAIRISDHPAKLGNFWGNDELEGRVLSLVIADDMERLNEWREDFDEIDGWDGDAFFDGEAHVEQVIFPADLKLTKNLADAVVLWKKTGRAVGVDDAGNAVGLDYGTELQGARFSKAEGETEPVSEQEAAVRDALIDAMRAAGIEVVEDKTEAQRVLTEAHRVLTEARGHVKLMSKNKKTPQETVVPGDETPFKATVVSSDAGAKVLQSLETYAENVKNLSKRQKKSFISDVGKLLNARRYGTISEYADFETVNGNLVTIRLSDHNAHTSGFDHEGRENGISIVISRKDNEGIVNDGNAHLVEFFYSDKQLNRAEGDVYGAIVRSIMQTLYSGEYTDTTGIAYRQEVNFFRTEDGEAYGFTIGDKMYIDPEIATSETPIHEYGHLWCGWLKKANPKAWARLCDLMLGQKDVLDYVKRIYPELEGDALVEEVFNHYSGRRGAERLRREEEAEMAKAKGIFDKARVVAVFDRIRRALDNFWLAARHLFAGKTEGLEKLSAEDFADMAMADLLGGFNGGKTAQYSDRSGADTAIEGDEVLFRELDDEEDAELIAELESGPTVTTYSTKVKVNGGYIPPMSSKDNETGKMRKPEREGKWNEAEERPDMAYFDEKSGKWKFDLKKSNNKTTGHVDYNPYGHSGSGMLNDQFSEAQSRPDLVVVEMAVPESEVTSGYKAEKANDPVGWKPWKAGPITAKMTGTRRVMLSRWHKITREVPWPEVAQSVARDLGNQFDVLPTNTFPVQLRAELEKLGYQFIETNNKGVIQEGPYKGLTWTDRYYDINPELDKRKDRKKRAAHTAAVVRANSAQYTDNANSADTRLREVLVEGGRLAIMERDGKWRVEGMPGEFGSRNAAIDEWRERAAGNVVWYLSEDGDHIEVEGNGDMYEMVSRTTTTSGRKQRERMARQQEARSRRGREMVDELADKLGVNVRYVDDMSEEERAQFIDRQLRGKGWYNPRTGDVFINLGRHTRLYDILSTFLHETVAHKGLRRLFGKDFNAFVDNVYNNVNKGIRAEIDRMAEQQKSRASEAQRARHDDEHWRRVATEEYMAKLAERLDLNHPEQRTLWEKIKGYLLDMLRKVGVDFAPSLSDNDLRGILWESYHSMEMEGVVGYAKGKAFRDQMEREAVNAGNAAVHETRPIAAEPQAQYTGSLFDILPQAGAWARMMSNMSERELRNEIAKDGPNVTSSYTDEYDRRHIKDYNRACDEIQARLERELPGEARLLELLQDAEAQWADGAYKDERRSGVLAAIDTISRALDEERADLPRVEEGVEMIGDGEGGVKIEDAKTAMRNAVLSTHAEAGTRPVATVFTVHDDQDFQAVLKILDEELIDNFTKKYQNPDCLGVAYDRHGMVVIFTDRCGTLTHAKLIRWHEDTHIVYSELTMPDKEECGLAALEWLRTHFENGEDLYKLITEGYSKESRATEATARLVENLIRVYGHEGFLNLSIADDEKVAKLAAAIQYYFKHGKEDSNYKGNEVGQGLASQVTGLDERRRTGGGAQENRRSGSVNPSDEDLLFNDGDDDVDVAGFDAGRLTLDERITAGMLKASADNRAAIAARSAAMRELGDNLSKLRQAMARQREYDRVTVDSIVRLARSVMESGYFKGFSPYEVKRLMSLINHAAGREDITKQAGKVVDLLLKHQLQECERMLHEMELIKGSKVDSRGVEVQGALDPVGNIILKNFKECRNFKEEKLNQEIARVLDLMGSDDEAIADDAASAYAGLQFAQLYHTGIRQSKEDEHTLRQELKALHDEADRAERRTEDYRQKEASLESAIRHNYIERIKSYTDLLDQLADRLRGSVQRAKAFKEAEKRRVREIQHFANSDMEGRELRGHRKDTRLEKLNNSVPIRFVLNPLSNLDQVLRLFGGKNADGKGYLWNHFMRSWIDSADAEQLWKEKYNGMLDEKVAALFGEHRVVRNGGMKKVPYRYMDLYGYADALPRAVVSYYDGAEKREYQLSQSQLLYFYAVDKMPMGRATNRKMGVTDEVMARIEEALDPKLKAFADWAQDELLPQLGNEMNVVHKKMFGANMASIEHYFPFVRDKAAIKREVENGRAFQPNDRISTTTGAIKKRTANVYNWDIPNCNFFDVLAQHISEGCHWATFAELNRDFSTLLSHKRFEQKVRNMNTVYGNGDKLWTLFGNLCAITTDAYEPKRSNADELMVRMAKGVSLSKIAFNPMPAMKQLLSLPAFAGEISPEYLAEALTKGLVTSVKWAWENMPNYRKRVLSRTVGDYYLRNSEYDDRQSWIDSLQRVMSKGMLPNIGVDAWVIAVGSYGVYKTAKAKYLRQGYSKEKAERRAIQDAELCFNKSQQSSEGPYLAPIQVDHTFMSTTAMLFRNASTSYSRETIASARNLRRMISGEVDVDFMAKQLLRSSEVPTYGKRFDTELQQQIDGTLPTGQVYQLGNPGGVLQSAGFPDMPIELLSTRLAEKARDPNHPFPLEAVKGLVEAMNRPLAVFRYGNNAMNVIVVLEYQGKQFLVGVHFNQKHRGTEVSDVRGLFPKDNAEWLNWISQGKATYLDHKKIQALIRQQRINLAEVPYLDLESVANVTKSFDNPDIPEQKKSRDWREEDWNRAREQAKRELCMAYIRNFVNVNMFGWMLPWLWRIGGIAPLLLLGGDDDDKKKQRAEAARHSWLAPIEGLAYGDVISDFGITAWDKWVLGDKDAKLSNIGRDNPFYSDLSTILRHADNDMLQACNDMFNILVSMVSGASPQLLANWVSAFLDKCGGDKALANEWALLVARLLNVPQSQLDKIFFKEIGLTGAEASHLSADEIAERFARYKVRRGYMFTPWVWDDEGRLKKKKDVASKIIKGSLVNRDIETLEDAYVKADPYLQDLIGKAIKKRVVDVEYEALKDLYENSTNEATRKAAHDELRKRVGVMNGDQIKAEFERGDSVMRKVVGNEYAKRIGAEKDTYGQKSHENWSDESKAYWDTYQNHRTNEDIGLDVAIQNAIKRLKKTDEARAKEIDEARTKINDQIKKQLGQGGDDEQIMREYRQARRELMQEYGIE